MANDFQLAAAEPQSQTPQPPLAWLTDWLSDKLEGKGQKKPWGMHSNAFCLLWSTRSELPSTSCQHRVDYSFYLIVTSAMYNAAVWGCRSGRLSRLFNERIPLGSITQWLDWFIVGIPKKELIKKKLKESRVMTVVITNKLNKHIAINWYETENTNACVLTSALLFVYLPFGPVGAYEN